MIRTLFSRNAWGKKNSKRNTSLKARNRRAFFEPLESRSLLSVTLGSLATQTLYAGAPLNLALTSTGTANPVSYTVSVTNSNLTTTIPTGNTYVKMHVQDTVNGIDGDLAPQTVASFKSLVNQGFYNSKTFHRIIDNFMIQGGSLNGDGTGELGYSIDDEFNASLQFTGAGILAMANSGDDSNDSQFFITDTACRWLDFNHSIFGLLVSGDSVRNAINNVTTDNNNKPTNTVTITSASVITDNLDAVLRLTTATDVTSGSAIVTVTAKDTVTNETSIREFTVNFATDTANENPFLGTISPITTKVNTAETFSIPATDVEGDSIYYDAIVSPTNANISISVNHTTGSVTVTPSSSLVPGVYSIMVRVASSSSGTFDTQLVPLYIKPAAPTAVTLLSATDTGSSNSDGITSKNNSSGNTLQFQVDGVISGALVQLYADGTLIGEATATGTSAVITTTSSSTPLTDGSHTFTAKQTLKSKTVDVGNLNTTVDLASIVSTASATVIVDSTNPVFNFTPITTSSVGIAYNCQASVSGDLSGTITYSLTSAPSGMTVNATTGLITWASPTALSSPTSVVLKATDKAGNSNEKTFTVETVTVNHAPVLTASAPTVGQTDEDTPLLIKLTGTFINNGQGTTSISDALDESAEIGGIAITSLTGNGQWEYSIDSGVSYHTISSGSVSASSSLLLKKDAWLRYTPDGKNGETVTMTYRAWDATSGINSGRMDTSKAELIGGSTAFSTATDTATLTVNALNDAPALASHQPSLGSTDFHIAKIVSLTSFINNGTTTTTITDVDTGASIGGIAIFEVVGAGTWEYSLDGTTYTAIKPVSNTSALLLPKNAKLRYTPDGSTLETAKIKYYAWDATSGTAGGKADLTATSTAFSSTADAASLSVIDVNDAPVLIAGNPSLGSTAEDAAKTFLLSDIINNGTGTTTITDPDVSAIIGGIAITGITGSGKWEYMLAGSTTYVTISSISASSALLLSKDTTLRYTPNGTNAETATITYHAWDASAGTLGSKVNLSAATSIGGTTPYSSATDTTTLTVTALNDAPVLTAASPSMGKIAPSVTKTFNISAFINNGTTSTTITDVDSDAVIGGIAITAFAGTGSWEYSTDGTTFTSFGTVSSSSALLLAKTAVLRYTAAASLTDTPSITYRAWDTMSGTNGSKVDLSATGATGGTTAFSTTTDTASLAVAGGSLSGFVYFDYDNDGLRTTSSGVHTGIYGVPIKLLIKKNGSYVAVDDKPPVFTAADGSYHFDNLLAGEYRIQEIHPTNFVDGKETAGKVAGASKGTAGADYIDVTLAGGDIGTEYNFGEVGKKLAKLTMMQFLTSAPKGIQAYLETDQAPVVDLSASLSGTGYAALLPASGQSTAIAASDATVSDADSSMLGGMTVSLMNPVDGGSESLTATLTGTAITSNYSDGVLTLSGLADAATYAQVLKTVKYSNSATTPNTAPRLFSIVASDGIATSAPSYTKLVSTSAELTAALNSIYTLTSNWLLF
jgi:cyclophilin family peptidyl-prolyl cis-trans isomerase